MRRLLAVLSGFKRPRCSHLRRVLVDISRYLAAWDMERLFGALVGAGDLGIFIGLL